MNKEFVLSEKGVTMYGSKQDSTIQGFKVFFEEDVKEFVRLLKEIFPNVDVPIKSSEIHQAIDKLAGAELSGEK